MKHAYKSFLLENESPVKVCGDESLYALQNTSNNTVTLQGSNNAITWVNVIDIPAGTTKHVQSAFAFLKANGELHVNKTQGSLFSSSLVGTDSNGCIYTRRMIVDTTGAFWFDPDSCSYTLNKNSDGTINTEVYVDSLAGKTYTKTYTTTSTQITATGWVAS